MAKKEQLPEPPKHVLQVDNLDYSAMGEDFDPIGDYFLPMGPVIVEHTFDALKHARSYRGVHVGATLMATNPDREKAGLFLGFNDTRFEGDSKFCAEMRSRQGLRNRGYIDHHAIVVVGPDDLDVIASINERGRATKTLPPCTPCRDSHLADHMLVLTMGESGQGLQAWTGRSVKEFFDKPVKAERRRRARSAAPVHKEPPLISYEKGNSALFWANTQMIYRGLERQIRVNTDRELRMKRAEAAVEALQQAGRKRK